MIDYLVDISCIWISLYDLMADLVACVVQLCDVFILMERIVLASISMIACSNPTRFLG